MENRKSYILKIIDKISGQVFICNRNDDSFGNNLYKDKFKIFYKNIRKYANTI